MAIKPIDLQTLFVKMNEVSKEQSQVKEQAALQQSQAARAQVIRELEDDHRVTEAPEDSESMAVKDDESENPSENHRENDEHKESEIGDLVKKEVVTDPDIGRHVDLTG